MRVVSIQQTLTAASSSISCCSHIMDENIAKCALHHYDHVLPSKKGKPTETEWTVYAAIVAEEKSSSSDNSIENTRNLWVVSCATGTKCSNVNPPKNAPKDASTQSLLVSCVLRDCHAEALARRGLVRVLWEEISSHVSKPQPSAEGLKKARKPEEQHRLLERVQEATGSSSNNSEQQQPQFQLRSNLALHLYVSDSPCGDASIYPLQDFAEDCTNGDDNATKNVSRSKLNFTGAKVIVSEKTGVVASACGGDHQLLQSDRAANRVDPDDVNNGPTTSRVTDKEVTVTVAREDTQLLGKLRTKSGRSNLPLHLRSSCMSCSDKLVRWNVLGLQGALLSRYIASPLCLSSVVVSHDLRADSKDAQLEALRRATKDRIASTLEHLSNRKTQVPGSQVSSENLIPESKAKKINLGEWQELSVHIVSQSFARGKSAVGLKEQQPLATIIGTADTQNKKRKRDTTSVSPCGVCLLWDRTVEYRSRNREEMPVEQVVGVRGLCQGKKPKQAGDYPQLASRLSRHTFAEWACSVHAATMVGDPDTSSMKHFRYQELKQAHGNTSLQRMRSRIFTSGPLAGWLCSP